MPLENADLVTTLNKMMRLYAPILGSWMDRYPDFHGIDTCVGRDGPVAYPEDEDGMGYSHEEFEEMAAEVLSGLRQQTEEIQAACPVLRDLMEPFSVKATRGSYWIKIEVSAGEGLGAVNVSHAALKRPGSEAFFGQPVCFRLKSVIDKPTLAEAYERAVAKGLPEVIEFSIKHGLVLNQPGERAHMLRDWLAAFPEPTEVDVTKVGGTVHAAHADSKRDMVYILAEEGEAYERAVKSGLADRDVQIFSYPAVASAGKPSP